MTLKEIRKNFPFSGTDGSCKFCSYVEHCDEILLGLLKPNKCGGPFLKNIKDTKCFKDIINNSKDLDPEIAELVNENFWDLI